MARNLLTLDIGCGGTPHGDVNVDLYTEFIHVRGRSLLKSDAHYLPFKKGVFDIVFCSNLLEHLINLALAVKEMIRVSRGKIILYVPNGHYWRRVFQFHDGLTSVLTKKVPALHLFGWSFFEFRGFLTEFGLPVTDYRLLPMPPRPKTITKPSIISKLLRLLPSPFNRLGHRQIRAVIDTSGAYSIDRIDRFKSNQFNLGK